MVRRDVADVRDAPAAEPEVGVVIVQIRHTLAGAAAELADVVPRRRAGDERKVHRHAGLLQRASRRHRDVVDARDVLERAVGRRLQPEAHHLIDVLAPPQARHLAVARGAGAALQLALRQERDVPRRVVRHKIPLGGEEYLQNRQQKRRARPVRPDGALLREQQAARKVVGVEQPAALRLDGAEHVQLQDGTVPARRRSGCARRHRAARSAVCSSPPPARAKIPPARPDIPPPGGSPAAAAARYSSDGSVFCSSQIALLPETGSFPLYYATRTPLRARARVPTHP